MSFVIQNALLVFCYSSPEALGTFFVLHRFDTTGANILRRRDIPQRTRQK